MLRGPGQVQLRHTYGNILRTPEGSEFTSMSSLIRRLNQKKYNLRYMGRGLHDRRFKTAMDTKS